MKNNKIDRRKKRKLRIRVKIKGTAHRPRLSIFRSNRYIYAQIIDDLKGQTLAAVCEKELSKEGKVIKNKTESARALGNYLAEKAKKLKLTQIVFDRSGYLYHGRVKAFADGIREGGLKY